MQHLVNPKAYPPDVREKVLAMSQTAREIANRWILGWPKRVEYLIRTEFYLEALEEQTRQEERAKMDTSMNHLSSWEKAQVYELSLAPPAPDEPIEEIDPYDEAWDRDEEE